MHRAHVDDASAAALLVHLLERRARGEKGAVETDGEQLLPFGEGKLVKRRHDLDAGVADEDFEAAEGLGHLPVSWET